MKMITRVGRWAWRMPRQMPVGQVSHSQVTFSGFTDCWCRPCHCRRAAVGGGVEEVAVVFSVVVVAIVVVGVLAPATPQTKTHTSHVPAV